MSDAEPKGCLAAILNFFGVKLGRPADANSEFPYRVSDDFLSTAEYSFSNNKLPFRVRDDFLSAAEYSFYKVLLNAVGNKAVVCPKVNLTDLFFVVRPNENQGFRNKIDRKHVDFLLCAPATMKPLCGIELDDSSHSRRNRQDRDKFVEQVFQDAGLSLVRIPVQSAYSPTVLFSMLEQQLNKVGAARPVPQPPPRTGSPTCPRCGVPMIQRTAKRGPNTGQSFFGCPNYPKCREVT